jgi:hypothetical protein
MDQRQNVKKEILIHIGTHKTGTTSIQNFLAMNREYLLKHDGIYFPKTGTLGTNTGHHNIAWQLLNNNRFNENLGGLSDLLKDLEKKNFKLAILSSEDFEHMSGHPEIINAFDKHLCSAGFKTRYLVFFREVDGYAKSLFFELNKRGLESNFPDFMKKVNEDGCISYENNWHFEFDRNQFASKWNSAIGENKLTSIDYDKAKGAHGIIAEFLMEVGASKKAINKSRFAKRLNKTSKRKTFLFYVSSQIKRLFSHPIL